MALGRVARILEARDDPRLPGVEARTLDDRLREELAILWRTAEIRVEVPTPLDEVRTALVFFDATFYSLVPAVQRALLAAITPARVRADRTGRQAARRPRRTRSNSLRSSGSGPGSAAIGTATPA